MPGGLAGVQTWAFFTESIGVSESKDEEANKRIAVARMAGYHEYITLIVAIYIGFGGVVLVVSG
jgi:hypothetical protein